MLSHVFGLEFSSDDMVNVERGLQISLSSRRGHSHSQIFCTAAIHSRQILRSRPARIGPRPFPSQNLHRGGTCGSPCRSSRHRSRPDHNAGHSADLGPSPHPADPGLSGLAPPPPHPRESGYPWPLWPRQPR